VFERELTRSGGQCRTAARRGFTLIELLVVVAIIAMLLAVLMPSLSRAKEQAKAVKCLAHLRELGHGMMIYYDEWGNYPTHQWRLPDNSRIRWFNAMADALGGLEVQACPATEWEVGRNNSYGYNYKYVGSTRDNTRADNPWRPYECFPVRYLQAPSKTIAFADCDGTGWKLEWGPERTAEHLDADQDPHRLGNHGYVLDPTYIPLWSEETYSGGELEPYAWHNCSPTTPRPAA
jgi:prepilin-type N-terminal cleavage/methylation domain-containing protein